MKTIALILASSCLSIVLDAQDIPPAPAGKAVVYFARPSGLGFAINFTYFDSATFIARFNGGKYVRYECDPGRHLFWARSENRDFVSADLEEGAIYFIEAVPQMGALKAGVQLEPRDSNSKQAAKILKLITKKASEPVGQPQENVDEIISRGLERYEAEKAKKPATMLTKDKYYQKK